MTYYGNMAEMLHEQINLARGLVLQNALPRIVKTIGGFDQAFIGDTVISAGVVCDYRTLEVIERKHIITKVDVPYMPGYLAYREGPPIISVYRKLRKKPAVLMIDGHGIIHPRKVGLASYVGLVLKKPSIGVAKSRLCGEVIKDRVFVDGEMRGYYMKLGQGRPVYISPGHMVSIDTSRKIVLDCVKGSRLPEPIKLADLYANEIKSNYENGDDIEPIPGGPRRSK